MPAPDDSTPERPDNHAPGTPLAALRRTARAAECAVEWSGRLGGWLLLAMVALVFCNAFMRYAFTFSPIWLQELEWHLLAAQGALGIAYAWRHGDHIAVDVLSQRYSRTVKLWMNLLVAALIALPCALFFIDITLPYIERSYTIAEGSPDPGGLPYRFAVKSMVAAAFALIAVQAIAVIIDSSLELLGSGSRSARSPNR